MEELELVPRHDLDHAASWEHALWRGPRLGSNRRQLGEELVGGHTDRAPEVELVADVVANATGDQCSVPEEARRPRDVEERLVERERLDERRVAVEDLPNLAADVAVERMIA